MLKSGDEQQIASDTAQKDLWKAESALSAKAEAKKIAKHSPDTFNLLSIRENLSTSNSDMQ